MPKCLEKYFDASDSSAALNQLKMTTKALKESQYCSDQAEYLETARSTPLFEDAAQLMKVLQGQPSVGTYDEVTKNLKFLKSVVESSQEIINNQICLVDDTLEAIAGSGQTANNCAIPKAHPVNDLKDGDKYYELRSADKHFSHEEKEHLKKNYGLHPRDYELHDYGYELDWEENDYGAYKPEPKDGKWKYNKYVPHINTESLKGHVSLGGGYVRYEPAHEDEHDKICVLLEHPYEMKEQASCCGDSEVEDKFNRGIDTAFAGVDCNCHILADNVKQSVNLAIPNAPDSCNPPSWNCCECPAIPANTSLYPLQRCPIEIFWTSITNNKSKYCTQQTNIQINKFDKFSKIEQFFECNPYACCRKDLIAYKSELQKRYQDFQCFNLVLDNEIALTNIMRTDRDKRINLEADKLIGKINNKLSAQKALGRGNYECAGAPCIPDWIE